MSYPKRTHANLQDLLIHTKRNLVTGCFEWQRNTSASGYPRWRVNGQKQPVHRLVAELVHSNNDNLPFVLHSCDNPPCINPDHLRWGTASDNSLDRESRGRANRKIRKGSEMTHSKLNENKVLEIRQRLVNGEKPKVLAIEYGVHSAVIYAVKNRKSWKHI